MEIKVKKKNNLTHLVEQHNPIFDNIIMETLITTNSTVRIICILNVFYP